MLDRMDRDKTDAGLVERSGLTPSEVQSGNTRSMIIDPETF